MPGEHHSQAAHASAPLEGARVLVIGMGGLSCPAVRVLVQSGVTHFTLVDDDRVEASNLQRQTLYTAREEGELKVDAGARALSRWAPEASVLQLEKLVDRVHPDNALDLISRHTLVLEGADNFATKFLVADAAKLARVPCVQAGAVRYGGWALASMPDAGVCLRCVFEDIPRGAPETCAVAGVLGPVVGAMGAIQAALSLQLILGRTAAASVLYSYDALLGKLRRHRLSRRDGCPLCSGLIRDLDLERYSGACAA